MALGDRGGVYKSDPFTTGIKMGERSNTSSNASFWDRWFASFIIVRDNANTNAKRKGLVFPIRISRYTMHTKRIANRTNIMAGIDDAVGHISVRYMAHA
jgi:hypothetical protein